VNNIDDIILNAASHGFEWGVQDCALFAADVIDAQLGTEYANDYRGHYSSELGAAKRLLKFGFKNVEQIADYLMKEANIEETKKGDIAMADLGAGDALGVVIGKNAVFLTLDGMVSVVKTKCSKFWRVE
jgi:hypothetical protein